MTRFWPRPTPTMPRLSTPRTRCRVCDGMLVREPARLRCSGCGREIEIVNANAAARYEQRELDRALKPRSAECRREATY